MEVTFPINTPKLVSIAVVFVEQRHFGVDVGDVD